MLHNMQHMLQSRSVSLDLDMLTCRWSLRWLRAGILLLLIRLLIELGCIFHQPAQCCFSATVMGCCKSPVSMLARKTLHIVIGFTLKV